MINVEEDIQGYAGMGIALLFGIYEELCFANFCKIYNSLSHDETMAKATKAMLTDEAFQGIKKRVKDLIGEI